MAVALVMSGLRKPQNSYSIHYLLKRSMKYTVSNPIANSRNQLHHHGRVNLITRSISRKARETESPAQVTVSLANFSSGASPSFQKSGLVGWYLNMLQTRPVSTKCITSALIYAAADISSQTIVKENSEGYDLMRTVRMGGYGLMILGPSVHHWYNFMSSVYPKRDLLSTLKKIALGQTTYGPAMTVIFLSLNAALQGESGSEIVARLKRDLVPTLINGVMYWPFCDFVTFKFIPLHLQPLVTNSFSYLWTVYMTYMANLGKANAN